MENTTGLEFLRHGERVEKLSEGDSQHGGRKGGDSYFAHIKGEALDGHFLEHEV